MWRLLGEYWRIFRRPSAYISLGTLSMGGFIAGIIFWGGFNTALEITNTEQFCISCHEMNANPYQELIPTIHYTNRSGVRAVCSDCHVPHDWTYKIARKMEASKEVWGGCLGALIRGINLLKNAVTWPSANGAGSKPTTLWNAATATTSNIWISPCNRRAPVKCTQPCSPVAKKPASTATKASRIICRI